MRTHGVRLALWLILCDDNCNIRYVADDGVARVPWSLRTGQAPSYPSSAAVHAGLACVIGVL